MDEIKKFVRVLFSTWWSNVIMVFLLFLSAILLFRITFVNFVDNYELAYKFDARVGSVEVLTGHGYFVTWPFVVKVHTVDLRPMQVCINANQRVLNCKLVQFNPEGVVQFLSWHGRDDYSGPGNNATGVTTTFSEILKSYAYDGSTTENTCSSRSCANFARMKTDSGSSAGTASSTYRCCRGFLFENGDCGRILSVSLRVCFFGESLAEIMKQGGTSSRTKDVLMCRKNVLIMRGDHNRVVKKMRLFFFV